MAQRQVTVTLQGSLQDRDGLSTRFINLTPKSPVMAIGRSSKSHSMRGDPKRDNGFFKNPIISRYHAELSLDLISSSVRIRDLSSMHGTSVNRKPLPAQHLMNLANGDIIIIGSAALENHEKDILSRTFRVTMNWQPYTESHAVREESVVELDCPDSSQQASSSTQAVQNMHASNTIRAPSPCSEPCSECDHDEVDADLSANEEAVRSHISKPFYDPIKDLNGPIGATPSQSLNAAPGASHSNPLTIEEDADSAARHRPTSKASVRPRTHIALSDVFNLSSADKEETTVEVSDGGVTSSWPSQSASSPFESDDHVFTPASSREASPDSSPMSSTLLVDQQEECGLEEESGGEQSSDDNPVTDDNEVMGSEAVVDSRGTTKFDKASALAPQEPASLPIEHSSVIGSWGSPSYSCRAVGGEYHPLYPVHGINRGLLSHEYGQAPRSSILDRPEFLERHPVFESGMSAHECGIEADLRTSLTPFGTLSKPATASSIPAPEAFSSLMAPQVGSSLSSAARGGMSRVSISAIVDPVSAQNESVVGAKRKAARISDDVGLATSVVEMEKAFSLQRRLDLIGVSSPVQSTAPPSPITATAAQPGVLSSIGGTAAEEAPAREPARKKARLAAAAKPFLFGTLVGSVGVIGVLLSLPESFF